MTALALLSILFLAQDKVSFDEKILATIPEGTLARDITFYKDGRLVAYRAVANGKMHVVINALKHPDYPNIAEGLRWTNDGRIAYRATNGSQWFVVVGGTPGPATQSVGMPVFSADGKKFAYEGSRGIGAAGDITSCTVYVNGAKGADFAACGQPAWSGDGSVWAHTVRIGKPGNATRGFYTVEAMVVNGKVGPEYLTVSNPFFAPKGKALAYRAKTEAGWTMNLDGKAHDTYDDMGSAVFSDDGKHLAYQASKNRKHFVVIDGKKGPEYSAVSELVWSPDNKTLAYIAKDKPEEGEFIVIGERKTDPYSRVYPPVFSSDGQHVAYGARSTNGKYMVVLDDKSGPAEFEAIGPIVLSPDGKHTAFAAQYNLRWTCAIDSGRASMNDIVQTPTWSPDSKKVAWAGQNQGRWFVEVNYRRGDDYDEVLAPPVFSSDGKKCAYGVRRGPDLMWRVVTVAD